MGNPPQSYETSPALMAHSVICHPTQVNAHRLNPSQARRYSINVPWKDRRQSWPMWLATYWDGLTLWPVNK